MQGKFRIITHTPNPEKVIEECGRVAWKSEDKITNDSYKKFIKMITNKGHESVLEHASMTVLFKMSIAAGREFLRHRPASPTQSSTRYVTQRNCDFVHPPHKDKEDEVEILIKDGLEKLYLTPIEMVNVTFQFYNALLDKGWKKEDARQYLMLGNDSDIVFTANFREWRHIFKLRCDKAAHWEIRGIMKELLKECIERWPVIFEDLNYLVEI